MSRIFEALLKGRADLAEMILPPQRQSVTDVPPPMEPRPNEDSPFEPPTPAVSSMAPYTTKPPLSHRFRYAEIQTLPISIGQRQPLFPFDESHREASEQYRIVRTKIIHHLGSPKLILVSSATPGDGKTVTAINLAAALSLSSMTLLIDADFRRSTMASFLGLPAEPGVANVLEQGATPESAMIRAQQYPNLYVAVAGKSRFNPAELLDSPQWKAFCAQVRTSFEYVIMDAPPVAAVADYDLLQAAADGVIMIVQPDHTNRRLCLEALEIISKEKFIGVLMNRVRPWLFHGRSNGYSNYY